MVDSERAGQTLLENDPNSKYPKCQVFDLSIESNDGYFDEDSFYKNLSEARRRNP